jgi:S-DNA-T family DNA segregation ATPase FtsK/SpoIIIE
MLEKNKFLDYDEETEAYIEYTSHKLIDTLASFGVGAKVLNVSKGPTVTRYELQPNAGVKVSKILSLSDDIALNLAATGVRIEAPIPGKAAVGIEIPNKNNVPVLLRDVIESEEFKNYPSKLAFAVGKDIAGNVVVGDIAKMPHLLIAGCHRYSKSVCINTLIISILYKASPAEVRLLMVDPKVVELVFIMVFRIF